VVQVFEGTSGLSVSGTRARFLGKTMLLPVSDQLLGRVFDGLGRPMDGLPEPVAKSFLDVNGSPINPERRDYPTDLIQTGVSVIDGMLTLVRGQKLPIFSGAGMPHNMLAAQIARQATVVGKGEEFAVVFAAVGVSHSEAAFFKRTLEESGAIRRSILYLNLADDPAIERIITPRVALTAAEYLAFELDMHVLVIITDITNYCFHRDTEVILGDGSIEEIGNYIERTGFTGGAVCDGLHSVGGHVLVTHVSRSSGAGNHTALSWTAKGLTPSRILALEKVKAPKELVRILARSGAELTVTSDHKILVDGAYGPQLVEAGKLRSGMDIYSVRKFELNGKAPTFLELIGDREDFFLHMKDGGIETALASKYGSLRKACTALNLKYRRLSNSFAKRCYTPFELITAASALGSCLGTVTERIDCITFGKHQKVQLTESHVTPRVAQLLGWVASNGAIYDDTEGNHYVSFTNRNRHLIRKFIEGVEELFPGVCVRVSRNSDGVTTVRINSSVLSHIFRKFIQTDSTRDISPVFKLPESHIAAFLGSYLDGEGSVPKEKKFILYATTRKMRAKRLQQLLKRLGIPSIIQERSSVGTYGASRAFDVVIRGASYLTTYGKLVPVSHPAKKRNLLRLLRAIELRARPRGEMFELAPLACADAFRAVRKRYRVSASKLGKPSTISQFENHRRRVTRRILSEWLENLRPHVDESDSDFVRLHELVSGNYILDRIVSVGTIQTDSQDFVYDFTVSDTHKIISENGIITSNCEALREISAAREEVPGRKGFPGYLYTDLATNYERAGRIKGKKGSITQMPILTMPSDDVTHPIPDLTGYITEGQIFLGRDLFRKGIYPPVYVLSSLSRLMGPALGHVIKEGKARPDFHNVGNQLYNAYARSVELRALAEIVGRSGLTSADLKYLKFGDEFEQKYLNQGYDENRTFEDTLRIAWDTLSILPESELTNIKEEFIKKYYVKGRSD